MKKKREAVRHSVDINRFKEVLKEKNLTFGDISIACGYSKSWLSNELYYYKGFNNLQLKFLSSEFGISYDDIKPLTKLQKTKSDDNNDIEAIKKDILEIKTMLSLLGNLHNDTAIIINMLKKLMNELGIKEDEL